MSKTEVYTWRVAAAVKVRLEEAARRERRSVASLLDAIVTDHLTAQSRRAAADAEWQREVHARVARLADRSPDRTRTAAPPSARRSARS